MRDYVSGFCFLILILHMCFSTKVKVPSECGSTFDLNNDTCYSIDAHFKEVYCMLKLTVVNRTSVCLKVSPKCCAEYYDGYCNVGRIRYGFTVENLAGGSNSKNCPKSLQGIKEQVLQIDLDIFKMIKSVPCNIQISTHESCKAVHATPVEDSEDNTLTMVVAVVGSCFLLLLFIGSFIAYKCNRKQNRPIRNDRIELVQETREVTGISRLFIRIRQIYHTRRNDRANSEQTISNQNNRYASSEEIYSSRNSTSSPPTSVIDQPPAYGSDDCASCSLPSTDYTTPNSRVPSTVNGSSNGMLYDYTCNEPPPPYSLW